MSAHDSTTAATAPMSSLSATEASLPRLLRGARYGASMTLDAHVAEHGPRPRVRAGGRRHARSRAAATIDEVERSGLRGHGGAEFPTATKLRAVAGGRGRVTVVANAAEGEPASLKDRLLLEMLPHLVLDGAVLAAEALGADEVIVAVCDSAPAGHAAVERALAERRLERSVDGVSKVTVASVPAGYVAGQESALVNLLGGGEPKPTLTPPLVSERGLRRGPTLVDNVETLAHLALVCRHGADWFRELGTAAQPGSALVTLSGAVADPGVFEIEYGASFSSLIGIAGGLTVPVRGALVGGYAGSWIGVDQLDELRLSRAHLADHGASLGAGVIVLLSEGACPVAETARVARWMAGQSARQCGPCEHGLDSLAGSLEGLAFGRPEAHAIARIEQLASLTSGRGACGHPDGAVRMVISAVETFAEDFADHLRHGPCEACSRPCELPLPSRAPRAEHARPTGRRG